LRYYIFAQLRATPFALRIALIHRPRAYGLRFAVFSV
jgi:hypothetical protein